NVLFNNRYLTLEELINYLCATDVYITPYINKDQIVSGTLAYALGCGKAIVSTPYLYAEEVLSKGRGILVDFRNPAEIAEAVDRILSDPLLRESLESKAYKYGRRAAWFNVAIDYLDLFDNVRVHGKVRAIKAHGKNGENGG
ncbi:MAG: glycosyltransferase, partial [Armatimonadetes bacterium]|nr:glycosyltransferase [Armatimonadota bacterium]